MAKNQLNEGLSSLERSDERIKVTGEVFTPMELCHQMISEIDISTLQNPSSTFLDPSAGSGNFLFALQTELLTYHSLSHINDNMLYGVELMEDNHKEMCERLGVSTSHPHIICCDALEYDYSFGQAIGLEMFM
jgi:hypothetical protein